jgi:hypothetical protein
MIFPQFIVSSRAISSIRSRRIPAILWRIRDRSSGVIRGQGPLSKASRAAPTAASTSAMPAFGTRPMTLFVVGLTVSKVSPLLAGTLLPPMINWYS